ncbi:hypothetical protein ACICHK_00115 [Streptomyces sp. AHU1]|uniref:hypothetical protein n=1 Tax=Streptomyces sp. AHU1 TaxID=3377215 RepID=UPI003877ABBC
MRVHLHRSQRDFLLGCFQSNHPSVRGGPALLAAVQSAGLIREHCYVEMDDEMVEAASYLFRFASLRSGLYRAFSRNFDASNILRPRQQTPRKRLLAALEAGAEIREVRSFQPTSYKPRREGDRTPWVVHDPGLRRNFRLPDRDVHPVWPLQPTAPEPSAAHAPLSDEDPS